MTLTSSFMMSRKRLGFCLLTWLPAAADFPISLALLLLASCDVLDGVEWGSWMGCVVLSPSLVDVVLFFALNTQQ